MALPEYSRLYGFKKNVFMYLSISGCVGLLLCSGFSWLRWPGCSLMECRRLSAAASPAAGQGLWTHSSSHCCLWAQQLWCVGCFPEPRGVISDRGAKLCPLQGQVNSYPVDLSGLLTGHAESAVHNFTMYRDVSVLQLVSAFTLGPWQPLIFFLSL